MSCDAVRRVYRGKQGDSWQRDGAREVHELRVIVLPRAFTPACAFFPHPSPPDPSPYSFSTCSASSSRDISRMHGRTIVLSPIRMILRERRRRFRDSARIYNDLVCNVYGRLYRCFRARAFAGTSLATRDPPIRFAPAECGKLERVSGAIGRVKIGRTVWKVRFLILAELCRSKELSFGVYMDRRKLCVSKCGKSWDSFSWNVWMTILGTRLYVKDQDFSIILIISRNTSAIRSMSDFNVASGHLALTRGRQSDFFHILFRVAFR